jgi:hypothetical protein
MEAKVLDKTTYAIGATAHQVRELTADELGYVSGGYVIKENSLVPTAVETPDIKLSIGVQK